MTYNSILSVLVFFLGLSLGLTTPSHAVDVEFIADQQIAKLQDNFSRLPVPSSGAIERALINRSWLCELYGVRTRLQVERNVSLYSFFLSKNALKNRGSYPIDKYRLGQAGIVGAVSNLEDVVRLSVDGNSLISELSAPSQHKDGNTLPLVRSVVSPRREAVAYAVCR